MRTVSNDRMEASGLRWWKSLGIVGLEFLMLQSPVFGLSPIVQFHDLVAGSGEPGYEDGPFYSARLDRPTGLALSQDGTVLYVADQGDHRIRAVALTHRNRVTTLTGNGKPGHQDGPLNQATFQGPTALAILPGDKLAVNDEGNHSIRWIDLKAGTVSTLPDPLLPATATVRSIAYDPGSQRLYLSQPAAGLLRCVDLETQKVTEVLNADPRLPRPGSLAVQDEGLFVADEAAGKVFLLEPPSAPATTVGLTLIGQTVKPLALAGTGKALYALQADAQAPLTRLRPDPGPITFVSVWGQKLLDPPNGSLVPDLQAIGMEDRVGFLADPTSDNRLFMANPGRGMVTSFRDLRSDAMVHADVTNKAGLADLEYPYRKPARTFRIILTGRSYLYWIASVNTEKKVEAFKEPTNRMAMLAKRLELTLNTLAALEDCPTHFEVLNGGMVRDTDAYIWPCYEAPGWAQKYDADLVLVMVEAGAGLFSYFKTPLDREGVPQAQADPEYFLKPNKDKFKSGNFKDLLDLCRSKKMLAETSPIKWDLAPMQDLAADPGVRILLRKVMGAPLSSLQKKLAALPSASGSKCRLGFCFFPDGMDSPFPPTSIRSLWKDICLERNIPFIDLTDDFTALRTTYYPFSEMNGMDHFTAEGHLLWGLLLGHELIRGHVIPFAPVLEDPGPEKDK